MTQNYYKNIINSGLVVVVIILLYRLLLPFGDEPDFIYKAEEYYFNIFSYSWSSGLSVLNTAFKCSKLSIPGNFFEFNMLIEPYYCNSKFAYFIFTFIIQITLTFILIFFSFLINRSQHQKSFYIFSQNNLADPGSEFKIIISAIIFPTSIYYFGIYSNEQIFIIISFLLFLIWKNPLYTSILVYILFLIDFGNAVVVLLFCFYYVASRYFIYYFSAISYVIISFFIFFLIIFFHNFIIHSLTDILTLLSAHSSYLQSLNEGVLKSQIFKDQLNSEIKFYYKPIVTYMTMMFMTPNYLKSYAVNIIFTTLFFISFFKCLFKKKNFNSEYFLNFIISVFFMLTVVLVLPSHSWFKYYVFLLPFMFGIIYLSLPYKYFIYLLLLSNMFTLINLIFYRLIFFI